MLGCLGILFRLERRILAMIFSYSLAIGLFSLIVPLTVQELVNTFAFAIQPITIVTLTGIMVTGLMLVGMFRALQFYAVEMLERRIFTRIALGMAQQLPHLKLSEFQPRLHTAGARGAPCRSDQCHRRRRGRHDHSGFLSSVFLVV